MPYRCLQHRKHVAHSPRRPPPGCSQTSANRHCKQPRYHRVVTHHEIRQRRIEYLHPFHPPRFLSALLTAFLARDQRPLGIVHFEPLSVDGINRPLHWEHYLHLVKGCTPPARKTPQQICASYAPPSRLSTSHYQPQRSSMSKTSPPPPSVRDPQMDWPCHKPIILVITMPHTSATAPPPHLGGVAAHALDTEVLRAQSSSQVVLPQLPRGPSVEGIQTHTLTTCVDCGSGRGFRPLAVMSMQCRHCRTNAAASASMEIHTRQDRNTP